MTISYATNTPISIDQYAELMKTTTMEATRPLEDSEKIRHILAWPNLVVTAWDNRKLVGIGRSMTDFHTFAYMSDLAVHGDYQKRGIGKQLINTTQQQLGSNTSIFLGAYPEAMEYYPKIGFSKAERAWILPRSKHVFIEPNNNASSLDENIEYMTNRSVTAHEYTQLMNPTTKPLNLQEIKTRLETPIFLTTARYKGELVGLARGMSDTHIFAYIHELRIHPMYQNHGLAEQLIDRTQQQLGEETFIVSNSDFSPEVNFEKIGFEKVDVGWLLPRDKLI